MQFKVHILGTSSALPAFGRHLSAQLVEHFDRYFLIDCGEGTQMQLMRYKFRLRRLDAVFVSHLHGDHLFGLPGLLSSLHLGGRTGSLHIVGPEGLQGFVEHALSLSGTQLEYPLVFTSTKGAGPGDELWRNRNLEVLALPLVHRVPTTGFLFRERPRRRSLDAAKALSLGAEPAHFRLLKQEKSVTLANGRTLMPDDVLREAAPSLAYAYCSDTAFHPPLAEHIRGVDLLYHEATFLADMLPRAQQTQHSTAHQAAQLAQLAGAKRLLLGHFSARYDNLQPLLDEARRVFPNTHLATEGTAYAPGE